MGVLTKVIVSVVVLAGCSGSPPTEQARDAPSARVVDEPPDAPAARADVSLRDLRVSELAGLELLELLTGGAGEHEPLPLIVAIHGLGDNPAHFARLFEGFSRRARIVVPRGLEAYGRPRPFGQGYAWMMPRGREALVVPQMGESTDRLAALIEAVSARRPTTGRAVVTGFSQGGILSFTLATIYPHLVEGAVPIGGWLPRFAWPERRVRGGRRPVVRAFNGDLDELSPPVDARQSVAKLDELGFDAEVRVYRGVPHAITPRMQHDLFATIEEMIGGPRRPEPCEPCDGEPPAAGTCSICGS
jgi:phospholipase/carboxylesterase